MCGQSFTRANENYLAEGVALLNLAGRAADLFETGTSAEKRSLLGFVLSNCTWADGVLTPVYRQPFDMIVDASSRCAIEKAAGTVSSGLCQLMGGRGDSNPRHLEPQSNRPINHLSPYFQTSHTFYRPKWPVQSILRMTTFLR